MSGPDALLSHLTTALEGRYVLVREIGRGGMATVYLARERHPRRDVAIKVLSPEYSNHLMRERFLREVDLASQLMHPHIVPVFAAGEAEGLLYYVMPYISGESLRHRLAREGGLSLDTLTGIAYEVASALDHAHARGVVHRDVKPENILLSSGHALVADFGIARAVGAAADVQLTQTGFPIGTPAYMSPEQWSASGDIDGRSDQYSLACVLLEAAGAEPGGGSPASRMETVAQVLRSAPGGGRPNANTVKAIQRALAPDPRDRFSTVTAFATALGPRITGGPFPAPPRPGRRRIRAGAVAAVVALLATAGLVLLRLGTADAPRRVAVAAFQNQTGDPALDPLGPMTADWITQGLARASILEVVGSRTSLASSIAAEDDADSFRAVQRVADESDARIVVWGSYYRVANDIQFQARITDTRDGRILRALDPVTTPADSPLVAVEAVRQRVMGALATLFDERLSRLANVSTRPPAYDAYEEYIQGMTQFLRLNQTEAIEHFGHAAALDSTFVAPMLMGAFAHATMDRWAAADSISQRLVGRREDIAPSDRYILDWVRALTRGDLEASLDAVRRAAEVAPGAEVQALIGISAIALNRPREALDAYTRLDPERGLMRGFFLYWSYVTHAYHFLGEYERELEAATKGLRQYPDNPFIINDLIRAHIALGHVEEAQRIVEARFALPRRPWMTAGDDARLAALEMMAHGHEAHAPRVLERAIAWFASLPEDVVEQEIYRYGLARTLYVAGRWDDAAPLFERLAREAPDSVGYLGYLSAVAARRNDRQRALALSDSLASLARPYLFGVLPFWQARIAALLGERERAVALLRRALDEGFWFDDTFHITADLAGLRGYAPFDELLRSKG